MTRRSPCWRWAVAGLLPACASTTDETADAQLIESPEDYLLAYWLGRYAGFLSADL